MKKFLTKAFLKECVLTLLAFVVGAVIGTVGACAIRLLLDSVEIKWKPSLSFYYTNCPANQVDNYYFQKLETFVDPRDSNEYTVLKFADYKGCTMSEHDSGFLAGDTVTFHLMLENLRYKTRCSKCLDSTCERGRYYPLYERGRVCPAGWNIASAHQNAALFIASNARIQYWPTFAPVKVVDPEDPSGLKRLRSRSHDDSWGLVDTVDLNLSGYYNGEKGVFEYVDTLSIVWTSDAIATVIVPNDTALRHWELLKFIVEEERLKPEFLYPVRCIRIDDPKHIMDNPESDLILYYNNMRQLPYLYR